MAARAVPPANYFGGKAGTVGKQIAAMLPEHRIYVEPFGGMAGVLFWKKPSLVEVYNDLDLRLYTVFKVLRNAKKAKELKHVLELTPFHRESLREASRFLASADFENEVEVARCVITVLSMSISGSFAKAGYRNGGGKYNASLARMWQGKVANVDAIVQRIRDLNIECQPAEKVMLRHNEKDALFYCDPPYVHSTRNLNKTRRYVKEYRFEMTDMEHEMFLAVAKHIKGKVLISGYDNELYNTILKDWHRHEIDTYSGLAAALPNADEGRRTEVIWTNFPIPKQMQLFK